MKCRKAKKLVFEFIDGLDNDKERLELETHLAHCPECDKLASQLTRSMDLLHRAPQEKTSDNFEWKVRLKLNQERNAVRGSSVSYGALFRAWNVRYAATAAVAFAAVLAVGLFAVDRILVPSNRPGELSTYPQVTSTEPEEDAVSDAVSMEDVAALREAMTEKKSRPEPQNVSSPPSGAANRPEFQPSPQWSSRIVGYGTGNAAPSRQSPRLVGVIDRLTPMSATELDSIVTAETEGLTTAEEIQLLRQYMMLLQRHFLEAHMQSQSNR